LPASNTHTRGLGLRYIVIAFGNQRVKTPVVKKNLNPKYLAKEATFDLPVFASLIGTRGALLDFVVWDKDIVGKGIQHYWFCGTWLTLRMTTSVA